MQCGGFPHDYVLFPTDGCTFNWCILAYSKQKQANVAHMLTHLHTYSIMLPPFLKGMGHKKLDREKQAKEACPYATQRRVVLAVCIYAPFT